MQLLCPAVGTVLCSVSGPREWLPHLLPADLSLSRPAVLVGANHSAAINESPAFPTLTCPGDANVLGVLL